MNGMVVGAFSGSKATGETIEAYFNKGLDVRLETMSGHRFDTFMINAIEEEFDPQQCERLVKLLEQRRAAGDFRVMGFSCHNPSFARQVLDAYPAFQLAMMPYNFRNRAFEQAFETYEGSAAFVAMKPLVWTEYGISFCAINALEDFRQSFGFSPVEDASTRALRFIRGNRRMNSLFCAVNSLRELELLISAGEGAFTEQDQQVLENYNQAITKAEGIPLYLAGLAHDNLRMNYYGAMHLSRVLGVEMPPLAVNELGARERLMAYAARLKETMRKKGDSLALFGVTKI